MSFEKYLKYKNKYLQFKNQIGGMTKEEVLKAIGENNSSVIQRLDFLGFNSDEDIMLAVIDKNPSMLLTASPTLKKNST